MDKDILKIKKWRKTHEELLKFINDNNICTGDEIRTWIAQSIVHFTEVGVPQNIVDYFLSKLDYYKEKDGKKSQLDNPVYFSGTYPQYNDEDKYYYKTGIGPFVFDKSANGYVVKDTVNRLIDSKQVDRTKMTPVLVAFKVAENIIDNYEESERVIPKILINEFNKEGTQGIYTTMQDVQNSYEKRNAKDILVPLITLTELICNLIPEIKELDKKISFKINKLYEDKGLRDKYHLNTEVLWALNNARIIRNCDIHNPETLNGTTLYEAVGYCHILVLFISSLLASGEIKL